MLNIKTYNVRIELIEDLLGTVPKNKEVYASFIATKASEHAAKAEREQSKVEKREGSVEKALPTAEVAEPPEQFGFDDGKPRDAASLEERAVEEVDAIKEMEERGWTGFHEDAEGPFLFDYALKGYLSEAARMIRERGETKQIQDKVKRFLFVKPRRVRLPKPEKVEDFGDRPMLIVTDKGIVCERPLRAQTAQGPRVTVVRSDVILAGAVIDFRLVLLAEKGGGNSITKTILTDVLSYGQFCGLGQWRSGGWGRFELRELEEAD